jgi:hypothetical protein
MRLSFRLLRQILVAARERRWRVLGAAAASDAESCYGLRKATRFAVVFTAESK